MNYFTQDMDLGRTDVLQSHLDEVVDEIIL